MTDRKRGRTKLLVWKPRRRYESNKNKKINILHPVHVHGKLFTKFMSLSGI